MCLPAVGRIYAEFEVSKAITGRPGPVQRGSNFKLLAAWEDEQLWAGRKAFGAASCGVGTKLGHIIVRCLLPKSSAESWFDRAG